MFCPQIGIDLMGSEKDPVCFLESVYKYCKKEEKQFQIHFFGSCFVKKKFVNLFSPLSLKNRFFYHTCPTAIEMNEPGIQAVQTKPDSSLCQAVKALHNGTINGLISCSNTAALVSAAKFFLSPIVTIKRPALCVFIPTKNKPAAVLDVGANVCAKDTHLLQFALMGTAYQQALGISNPTVALLNIGREKFKGGAFLRTCYEKLSKHTEKFTFIGNLEPTAIFAGEADVVVTDGFVGNIFLKTAEAVAQYLEPSLVKNKKNSTEVSCFENSGYPGALLLGVQQLVMKCHGDANGQDICASLETALHLIEKNLIQKITESCAFL